MKKRKISLITFVSIMLSSLMCVPAFALDVEAYVNASASSNMGSGSRSATATAAINAHRDSDEGTSSENKNDDRRNSTSTGSENSMEHRSAVATFVQHLLSIANREGGIGAEVRVIAQAQNDASSSTVNAMAKIETRNAFKTFLIGSDYKNLGVIRSALATTSAQIARLKILVNLAENAQDKADLNAQIAVLEAERAKVEAFVEANESKFSIFGWFVVLFSR